jgi:hypothetical protein
LTAAGKFVYDKKTKNENISGKKFSFSACHFFFCILPDIVSPPFAFVGNGHFSADVFYRYGLECHDISEPGTPALA